MRPTTTARNCGVALAAMMATVGCEHAQRRNDGVVTVAPRPDKATVIGGTRYVRTDVQANAYTSSSQGNVALAQDRQGGTIVVWESRRQESGTYGIFARRLGASGQTLGGEVHVNSYTPNSQTRPVVSFDGTGNVWLAWESYGQDGDRGAIIARRFDASLSPLTEEIMVNHVPAGHQSEVAITGCGDGSAVAVWTTQSDATRTSRVLARRVGADGAPLDDAFPVGQVNNVRDRLACVGVDDAGTITVVWARSDIHGRPTGIVGRRFRSDCTAAAAEFAVSAPDGLMHIEPAIAVSPSGMLTVAWATAMKDDYVISLRRFAPDGSPMGNPKRVDQGGFDRTTGLAVAGRADGGFVVSWSATSDTQGDINLFARLYKSNGRSRGDVFRASEWASGDQRIAVGVGSQRAAYANDGRLTFAWSGDAGHGDSSGANVSLLLPPSFKANVLQPPQTQAPTDPSIPAEPHVPPVFDPEAPVLDRDALVAAEQGTGDDFGFLGVVSTGWTPPDPHMAVGPEHIVLMTNGEISFYEKDGTRTFQDEIENVFGFWGDLGTGNFVFDPEVVYDPYSQRFFAMANERVPPPPQSPQTPFFLLAVSDDADPNGAWHKYRFNVLAEAQDTDIDSPNIAVDEQAVYLSADFFGPDKYLIYMVDKAALLVGDTPTTTSLLITGSQSIGLAQSYDSPPAQYMAQAFESGLSSTIRLHAITDPLGNPQRQTFDLDVPLYTQPENPPSMGTGIDVETFEARFWSCMYRNGSLWATHHVGSSRVLQRWYQIRMNDWPVGGTPELVQSGEIDPGPGIRTFFGSIWADEFDNAAVVFARSSPTEFISVGRAGRLSTDPLGTMQPMVIMHESSSPVSGFRWGDYSAIATDPVVPGKFWAHHEFTTFQWMTWVGSFAMADAAPPAIALADPFDGYIDPRRESTDGTALDLGIDHLTIAFDEPIFNVGGAPLDLSAFDLAVTGGVNPGILSIDASANPTIEIELGGVLPVQQFATITADVEDTEGNAASRTVTYGFLPADVNQDGTVNPLDVLRFKQIVNGLLTPTEGPVELFVDIDRSGTVSPLDLLVFKQLINGVANATQPWAGQSLPP